MARKLWAQGLALSRELAELIYDVDYYVHIDTKEDAVKLVTHMPYQGHMLTTDALNAYAGPVVEQSVNQLVQLTPLEQINEKIHDITELVRGHLRDFLSIYGVTPNDVKVLIRPRDERMRELISLRAFGLSEIDAVRYYVAMKMAERGLVSAPNMAVGLPFNIGITAATTSPLAGCPRFLARSASRMRQLAHTPGTRVLTGVADSIADRLRGLLASDVYTERGRLRSDDLLVRERVGRALGEAAAQLRELISGWRADRVPPATREQPFPPAEVMEPIRRAERLIRAIDDVSARVRGLPVLNQDMVWDRVRRAGLDELLQFDWTLVGESDALSAELAGVFALDEVDAPAREARVRKMREVIADRQRYVEIS